MIAPKREVIVRQIALPGVANKDIAAAVGFQVETLHPYGEEDVAFGWQRVSENGTAQKIEFFDSTLTSTGETVKPGDTASVQTVSRIPSAFPRNIIALVLDGQSTELANLKHVREGMVKYIRERISDTDSVALFSISGGLKLLQSFTQDKARLIAAVENAYDSSIVSKTSEARDIAANIESLRDKIAGGPTGPIASTPAAEATHPSLQPTARRSTSPPAGPAGLAATTST